MIWRKMFYHDIAPHSVLHLLDEPKKRSLESVQSTPSSAPSSPPNHPPSHFPKIPKKTICSSSMPLGTVSGAQSSKEQKKIVMTDAGFEHAIS